MQIIIPASVGLRGMPPPLYARRRAICSFDHVQLAGLRCYGRFREDLDNLINEARQKEITMPIVDWLAAMEDMALTSVSTFVR
ncbi:MAG: hypothetical protein JO296_03605 [Pseudonocardiales bacterium]|nr:hypothetical protein [Pseudonocardiales bacterium]MBV9649207.1 hypothetical protein [Pseudonocardiales bacterium]